MQHHLVGRDVELVLFKTVENAKMLFERLTKPKVRHGGIFLGRTAQPVVCQKRAAGKAVGRTFGYEAMELRIEAGETRCGDAPFPYAEEVLHPASENTGFLAIDRKTGSQNGLWFQDQAEGKAFIHGLWRIQHGLKCPGATGQLGGNTILRQYF